MNVGGAGTAFAAGAAAGLGSVVVVVGAVVVVVGAVVVVVVDSAITVHDTEQLAPVPVSLYASVQVPSAYVSVKLTPPVASAVPGDGPTAVPLWVWVIV